MEGRTPEQDRCVLVGFPNRKSLWGRNGGQAKAGFSQYEGLEETVAVDSANPGPGGQQS